MMDISFIIFSFTAGLVAFFAPCSFAFLPGYVTYYMANYADAYKLSSVQGIIRGVKFGFIASAGFFVVFGLFGALVIGMGQIVKQFIPWIAAFTGIAIMCIGLVTLFGKEVSYFQVPAVKLVGISEKKSIFLFGIVYAIGSLGCVFPIFLSIVLQGLSTESLLEGSITILAYVAAMGVVMTLITTFIFWAKYAIIGRLEKFMPYFKKISSIMLILAGGYMVYYQYSYLM